MQGFRQYNTNNPIDNIVYGDLMLDNKSKITCEDKIINYCFATGLINKFFSLVPPKNSSQETINELLFLERVTNNATQEEINFSTLAEIEEKKCYVNFCKNVLKLDVNTIYFEKIMEQTDPLLMLLKNHFNRPRPYQLAPYYNIQLKFQIPVDAFHPAYPSGHGLDAFVIEHVLNSIKPDQRHEINKFCNDMAYSRFVAGVHYPSDNKISKILADTLFSHNLIKLPSIS
jgi:hypothetical protein